MEHPEADVTHFEYTGGDTPLLRLNEIVFYEKDEITGKDLGKFAHKEGKLKGKLKKDLFILKHNPNK